MAPSSGKRSSKTSSSSKGPPPPLLQQQSSGEADDRRRRPSAGYRRQNDDGGAGFEGVHYTDVDEVAWIGGGVGGGGRSGGGGVDFLVGDVGFGNEPVMGDWRSYVGSSILNTWNWNAEPNEGFVTRILDITEIE